MDDTIFRSECGLVEIGDLVLHSVTDKIGFGGCIHHSMISVVVEGRAYDVAIAATEVPRLCMLGLLCMKTWHPAGPIGVGSYLNGQLKYSHSDMAGARVDWRRKFRVSSA